MRKTQNTHKRKREREREKKEKKSKIRCNGISGVGTASGVRVLAGYSVCVLCRQRMKMTTKRENLEQQQKNETHDVTQEREGERERERERERRQQKRQQNTRAALGTTTRRRGGRQQAPKIFLNFLSRFLQFFLILFLSPKI